MNSCYTDHLLNPEFNTASQLWYHAEDRLHHCVEQGDPEGALQALADLTAAVNQRFSPILTPQEISGTLLGILGGILHFACRDAGLPPAYLTLMILWQKDVLSVFLSPASSPWHDRELEKAIHSCILYACEMVQSLSLPDYSLPVRRCITLIQQNLTGPITVDSLADALGITRQYLSFRFHQETGKTPTEYINEERIKLSKYYLQQNQFTITQIALSCGYNDSNYFGRIFKNLTGKTPTAYRNSIRRQ